MVHPWPVNKSWVLMKAKVEEHTSERRKVPRAHTHFIFRWGVHTTGCVLSDRAVLYTAAEHAGLHLILGASDSALSRFLPQLSVLSMLFPSRVPRQHAHACSTAALSCRTNAQLLACVGRLLRGHYSLVCARWRDVLREALPRP